VRTPADFWPQWLYSVGYKGVAPEIGTVYETNQLCYEAAASGLGVVLAVPLLANRYLSDRRLRACAVGPAPTGMAYWIHHANPSVRRSSQIKTFIDWLKTEASETKRQFKALTS
jgi:LysR family glycine cleavage system transcriptional activator